VHLKQVCGLALGAFALFMGGAIPAQAASAPGPVRIVTSDAATGNLTIQLDKPVSASTASRIESSLERATQTSHPNAGPTGGAFLVCNKVHSFSDSDGTFTFQHRCGGTTGPWGYRLSAGLCSIVISRVNESGMTWTRNGKRQGKQSPHPGEVCRYQFHGNFNPEHDFDIISYSDNYTFRIDVGGETGSADLNIHGSFYSAKCTNPAVCG
jgi:hypothetical protein